MTGYRPPDLVRRTAGAMAAGSLALAGVVALPTTSAHADTAAKGDVIANLWEWNWDSVAKECTDVLGPAGYGAVQVAPPEESLKQSNYYWWDVYQPYSYDVNDPGLASPGLHNGASLAVTSRLRPAPAR